MVVDIVVWSAESFFVDEAICLRVLEKYDEALEVSAF